MNALKSMFLSHINSSQATTQEENWKPNKPSFAAQKEHGISMFGGVGCFPLLIKCLSSQQSTFAAQHTEGVAEASFLESHLVLQVEILIACTGVLEDRNKTTLRKMMSPDDDCHVLNFLTSQRYALLICRWFHDDPSAIHRQQSKLP